MPCNESWIYCYDPETKSSLWKHAGSSRPMKVRQSKSTRKLLMISFFLFFFFFFDSTGMIYMCWPLPTESLPELPKNLNIVFLVDCLSSANPVHVDHGSTVKKSDASIRNSDSWSLSHSSRSSFHRIAFFPSLTQNFIAYRSSKVSSRPDWIFEIHQLWQLGFSRVYSNCCCSCSFETEIIIIGQSSNKMYSNNIVNFQESTTSLNACTKIVCKGTTYLESCQQKQTFYSMKIK